MTVFRVTERSVATRILNGLNGNLNRMGEIQQKMSTGKEISKPSDSPTGTVLAMRYRSDMATVAQYSRNAIDGKAWLNGADSALGDATGLLQRARDLALQGASAGAAGSQDAREALAVEVDNVRKSMIAVSNTRYLDRPIFGGNTAGLVAYDENGVYQGDDGTVLRTVGDSNRVQVNTSGPEAFGTGTEQAFQILADLSDHLRNNPSALTADLDRIDAAATRFMTATSSVGARLNQVTSMQEAADLRSDHLTAQLSDVEDIDLAKTITDMRLQESAYQVALSAASKVIQPSLVDFLR
jgi:flagellar hook-associated protein 3 FlgL